MNSAKQKGLWSLGHCSGYLMACGTPRNGGRCRVLLGKSRRAVGKRKDSEGKEDKEHTFKKSFVII